MILLTTLIADAQASGRGSDLSLGAEIAIVLGVIVAVIVVIAVVGYLLGHGPGKRRPGTRHGATRR
jgi:hypothetical protein